MEEVLRHNSVTVIFPAECNSFLEFVLAYVDYWWVFVCNKFGTLIIWWELIFSQKACKRKFKWKVGIHGVQNIFEKYFLFRINIISSEYLSPSFIPPNRCYSMQFDQLLPELDPMVKIFMPKCRWYMAQHCQKYG